MNHFQEIKDVGLQIHEDFDDKYGILPRMNSLYRPMEMRNTYTVLVGISEMVSSSGKCRRR
jgi:hypothetical protein